MSIPVKCSNFCAYSEILRDSLVLTGALYGERIEVLVHFLGRHAIAVIHDRQLILAHPLKVIPVNVPLNDPLDLITGFLSPLNCLDCVLCQFTDLLIWSVSAARRSSKNAMFATRIARVTMLELRARRHSAAWPRFPPAVGARGDLLGGRQPWADLASY